MRFIFFHDEGFTGYSMASKGEGFEVCIMSYKVLSGSLAIVSVGFL
jgi:hypothetical protein